MDATAVPLRDRLRAETRAQIAEAALTIAEREGLDSVGPDAIAAAVGISRRTLFNYVHGAPGALAIPVEDLLDAINAEFIARPPEELPVVAVSRALAALAPEQLAQALRLQRISGRRVDVLLDELRVKVWLSAEAKLLTALSDRVRDTPAANDLDATAACLLSIGRVVVKRLNHDDERPTTPERLARVYEQACGTVSEQLRDR